MKDDFRWLTVIWYPMGFNAFIHFIFIFFQNYNGLTMFWLNSSEKRCLGGGSVSGKSGGGQVGMHPMKKKREKTGFVGHS